MDNLTGTGFSSSPRRVISSTERRRAGVSVAPTRKDDPSRSASIATLGVSMLTTGIPLPGSAQTRLAQCLCFAGISQTPLVGVSQLLVTTVTRRGSSSGQFAQSCEAVTSVLDIPPVAGVYTDRTPLRRRLLLRV